MVVELTVQVSEEVATRLEPIRQNLPALLQQIALSIPSEAVPDNPVDDTDDTAPVYVEFLNFLVSGPPPQAIKDFKVSAATQERLQKLREKSYEATLSRSEQTELDAYAQVEHVMALLKLMPPPLKSNSTRECPMNPPHTRTLSGKVFISDEHGDAAAFPYLPTCSMI